ncbi:AMP-dependent synthetase [Burkholderia cepacia]|uniref:AMP-binding protein n=1 Tax=Burkholderia cepacia TaxID=292 RepID=UPI0007542631|nr:AMP-binding protein [Burkholderia cepacia]KVS51494.1 AMP-dependent synthetase [Burkholderia cepacia]KVS58174.1 AMP-dependent synthetase [Burkholderia cepacia]RQT71847.1 AMP-dependent synthetase [Burkholderia cepacia]RQT92261.1 AMP-dependent synthetase [Burkholderia cepacia]RQZ68838.1 AMP-dependent synthetase [Burkholderia cepacia]
MIALHEMLCAEVDSGVAVCRDGAAQLTLGDLRARVDAIARMVEARGARRVAICTDDPYAFACAFFAVAATHGEIVIPASNAPGYLGDLAHAYDLVLDAPALAAFERDTAGEQAIAARPIDAAAAVTLYTSGSSGTAKPVRKSLAQFDAEVRTLQREWGSHIGAAVTLSSVPHHHIYGLLFRILWPLATGRAFDRMPVLEPLQLQQRLAEYCGGVVVSTPSQLMRWPALPGFLMQAPAPCALFSSGGPLSADAAMAYSNAFGAAPLEIFGSTETGGIAWRRQDVSSAWQPLTGVDVRCDDDGVLCVRSAHLGHDHWHHTDDTARFDAYGRFALAGRRDRVVKLDGKRVSLPELEARLHAHAYVEHAAAVVVDGTTRAHVGVVAVLTAAGRDALASEGRLAVATILRHALGAYFDAAALPRYWRFRHAMPFDARGKLPAAALAAAFTATPEGFELLASWRSDDALHYELRVPAALAHFEGHFPGQQILPGVVQIDWAARLAGREMPAARAIRSIEHLKFKAPVPPGAVLALRIAHDPVRGRARFAFRCGGRECTSGVLVYGAAQ